MSTVDPSAVANSRISRRNFVRRKQFRPAENTAKNIQPNTLSARKIMFVHYKILLRIMTGVMMTSNILIRLSDW